MVGWDAGAIRCKKREINSTQSTNTLTFTIKKREINSTVLTVRKRVRSSLSGKDGTKDWVYH